MNWLDHLVFHADPTGLFVLAFVTAVVLLTVGRVVWLIVRLYCWLAWNLLRAGLLGFRDRLRAAREVRDAQRRIRANHVSARWRRARAGARP